MKTFKLRIVTSRGRLVKTDVESFSGYTTEGSFQILPNHSPIIAILKDTDFEYSENGVKKGIHLEGGIMKFKENRLTITAARGAAV
jgi:F0F1-type ATP synthase epsilon subunit